MACLGFLLCNSFLSIASKPFIKKELQVTSISTVASMVLELRSAPLSPKIAFIGSSVINVVIKRIWPAQSLGHMTFLIPKEGEFKGEPIYNLALNGQVISDCDLLVNELLIGQHAPTYLIMGIIPKDFIDPTITSTVGTSTFLGATNWLTMWKHLDTSCTMQQLTDSIITRAIFLYQCRNRIQTYIKSTACRLIDTYCGKGSGLVSHPERSGILAEYQYKYSHIDQNILTNHMRHFCNLLSICKSRGIKVIVVSMPVTKANFNCLPPGFYSEFTGNISHTCQHFGAHYYDLACCNDYTEKMFDDSVHLNLTGSRLFLKQLANMLQAPFK